MSRGEVSSTLYLRPCICICVFVFGAACICISSISFHLLEKGRSLCVVLEYCEHRLQQASLDGQQLQHLVCCDELKVSFKVISVY